MVPKVAGKGTSFKGAGAYYLHDKGADTAQRVVFTHTENLPTTDPDLALRWMAYTALHQDEIKARAGVKATGRKSAQSVYTYSLSWAPDERPSLEEMIAAGKESLEALELSDHEALMVAHNDEPHPHLHLIVGRVHPETGIMARLGNDHLKLSRWAEAYEKRQGQIRCEQRVENNEKRRQGQFVKYRDPDGAAAHRRRKIRREQAYQIRQAEAANLGATHRGQRQALFDEKQGKITAVRQEVRAQNRSQWAALYRRQRQEWRALNQAQKQAWTRLRYALQQGSDERRTRSKIRLREKIVDGFRAVFGQDNPHGVLSRQHRLERKAFGTEVRRQTAEQMRTINERYRQDRDRLEQAQREEAARLQAQHSRESQDAAQEIAQASDLRHAAQETTPSVRGEFERKAWERIREARQRREEEKRRGKDRDGGRER